MDILLNSKEKITTDENNWVYSVKLKNAWENRFYYRTLQDCYADLLEYFVRLSDKEKLKDAIEESVIKLEKLKKSVKT